MWYSSNTGMGAVGPVPARSPQSIYETLLGLRGTTVTVLYLDPSDPAHPVTQVPAFLEEVRTGSLTLGLAAPLPALPAGTRFGIETATGPGLLQFQSVPHEPPAAGTTRLLLKQPRRVDYMQRRVFARAAIRLPVAFAPATGAGSTAGDGGVGETVDLSASGLRMEAREPLTRGQEVYVSFNAPDGTSYRGIRAKVVRCQPQPNRYSIALTFVGVSDATQQQLVRTVFRLQMKSLAKR